MTAEDQVRRRFRRPGARIRIGGDAPARLPHDQLGPVLALANGFIAGRQVEQDRRAGPRLHRTGGKRHPEVLADLDPHHDGNTLLRPRTRTAGRFRRALDRPGIRSRQARNRRRAGTSGSRKTPCNWGCTAWERPPGLAVRQCHGAIEKAIAHRHRQSNNDKLTSPGRGPGDPANRPKAPLQQGRLAKQIGTRVARDAKLGKQNDVAVGDLVQDPDNLRGVGLGIGDRGPDRSTGHADETKSVHDNQPDGSAAHHWPGYQPPSPYNRNDRQEAPRPPD